MAGLRGYVQLNKYTYMHTLAICVTIVYIHTYIHVCMYRQTYSNSMNQPDMVANPARGQLYREN